MPRYKSDPLRILNAMVLNQRRERQSDKEMALTAMMFNIKQENAEQAKRDEKILEATKVLGEERKSVGKLEGQFRELGGIDLKEVSPTIQTDGDALVGLIKMRKAQEVQEKRDGIEDISQKLETLKGQGEFFSERIGEYYLGAGKAAAEVWRKGFAGDDNVFTEDEFGKAMDHLKASKEYGPIATSTTGW